MARSTAQTPSPRYRELDSLRGIAAIGIVLWHYRAHFQAAPLAEIFEPFYREGYCSVDFFFVLSGLVLAKAYGSEPRCRAFGDNMMRRIARIYPLHFVTLIAAAMLQFVLVGLFHKPAFVTGYNDLYHFGLNLALSNYVGFQKGFSFNAPSWSISTEFYANTLFFVLIFFGRRLKTSYVAVVLVTGISLATLGNGRLERGGTITDLIGMEVSLVRTLFGFFIGVLLYEWVIRKDRHIPRWIADLLFVVTLAVMIAAANRILGRMPFAQYATVLLGFPLLIFTAIHANFVGNFLRLRPFLYLGDISFSLYLIHFPVQILAHILIATRVVTIDFSRPSALAAYFIVCLGLAGISHRVLELPAQRALNDWWRRRKRA